MGITSKGSRLPERPKPPSLNGIEEDLLEVKDTDIALTAGEKYLQNIDLASNCLSSQDSESTSSPGNTSSCSVDQVEISKSEIKESYNKVLRLLDLYSELKDAPSELADKISKLQVAGAEMSESIAQLKSLSQSIGIEDDLDESSKSKGKKDKSSHKEKSKGKRKK